MASSACHTLRSVSLSCCCNHFFMNAFSIHAITQHSLWHPANGMDNYNFARKLCSLVKPNLVIFSLERGRLLGKNHTENPRDDIMKGVISASTDAHIMCTQLSGKCAANNPNSDFSHLSNLPALGFASDSCCGGTIIIAINGKQTTYTPLHSSHKAFISNPDKVPTPMCLLR